MRIQVFLTQKSSRKYDSECSCRISEPDLDFYPSRIPDPGVKKATDPGSGTATLLYGRSLPQISNYLFVLLFPLATAAFKVLLSWSIIRRYLILLPLLFVLLFFLLFFFLLFLLSPSSSHSLIAQLISSN
jgi:hypothetical protein